ncbi:MAG: type II toxin-antitoxin system PemK/MazF family toxin [Caldilineaceae bacterium]
MGEFIKGQVVILPFPFSDLSNAKRRPAFVVAPLTGDDLIVCQITTVNRSDNYAVALNASDFVIGSLPHPSIIRPNRLFTADSKLIIRTAGTLSKPKIQEVINKIIGIVTA